MNIKRFDSSEGNVWKYVYDFGDAIAESVLYKYERFYERTVLCISIQSGCPVGCKFCGTGRKFIRNLTMEEIVAQVTHSLEDMDLQDIDLLGKRFQIMFMSMGEPMLNIDNVIGAIEYLHKTYPNAELLLSTIGVKDVNAIRKILEISVHIQKVGLQFSVHEAIDSKRNELIPFKNKLNLREIRDFGIEWHKYTRRPVYVNYCVSGENTSNAEINRLKDLFSPNVFNFTLSVICSADENMKESCYRNLNAIEEVRQSFLSDGYNVRVFNPAGQDDIGGGCGQLWYIQEWFKNASLEGRDE